MAIINLERASTINPLSDWPFSFCAWVPDMLGEFRGLRNSRETKVKGA
jgi:hypothetical protein